MQLNKNVELIISDNSDINKGELKEKFIKEINEKKIIFIETNGNLEMNQNWENGLSFASGEYILFLPDRAVIRNGALNLLENLLILNDAECVFWDTNIGVNEEGFIQNKINVDNNIEFEEKDSLDILRKYLKFDEYFNMKVFNPDIPRGLNSIIKKDAVEKIKNSIGGLFQSYNPDYCYALSVLCNVKSVIHLREPITASNGTESNGQKTAIYGVGKENENRILWRGLNLDCCLLALINDIEQILLFNKKPELICEIDTSNVILSILYEIHFKEWHGSPLNTKNMREILFNYINGKDNMRQGIDIEISKYDKLHKPRFVFQRKILQRLGLLYKIINIKKIIKKFKTAENIYYFDDVLSKRKIIKI